MHRRKQELKIRISVTWMWNSIYSTTSDFWSFTFLGRYVILGNKRYRHSGKVKQILFDFLRHKLNSGYKGNKAWQKCKNKTFCELRPLVPSLQWLRERGERGELCTEGGLCCEGLMTWRSYFTITHLPFAQPAARKAGWLWLHRIIFPPNSIFYRWRRAYSVASSAEFFHLWKKIRIFWRMIKRKLLIHHNWRCSKFAKS